MISVSRFTTFPDVEAILIQRLAALNYKVGAELPKTPIYPCVVIKRIGGTPAEVHHLDYASIQVEVWGNSKTDAAGLVYPLRTAIHELEGASIEGSIKAFITGVVDTLGVTWTPDPVTDRARYMFGVGVYLTVPNQT